MVPSSVGGGVVSGEARSPLFPSPITPKQGRMCIVFFVSKYSQFNLLHNH